MRVFLLCLPQGKIRGLTEEGGRMALSGTNPAIRLTPAHSLRFLPCAVLVYAGQNGWAFFDYHLAMFGPQEVPLGPFRLQMALPPFGCDPGAYTVRIQGAVVAILRGGGCSFGIKVCVFVCLGFQVTLLVLPMANPARPVPLSLVSPRR